MTKTNVQNAGPPADRKNINIGMFLKFFSEGRLRSFSAVRPTGAGARYYALTDIFLACVKGGYWILTRLSLQRHIKNI